MRYLRSERVDLGAESGEEAIGSTAVLQARLAAVEERIMELQADTDADARAVAEREAAMLLLELDLKQQAWTKGRALLDHYLAAEDWEQAAVVCEILFACEQPESLSALGQGVWLAVTFPVDPELSVALLQHIVDETPDDSDGAAVAAAAAAYVVDLRAQGQQREDLSFFTAQMLGTVARRHSDVTGQTQFSAWLERLELTTPEKFLVRLRNVIDVMVQDDWWFDRAALQARLPIN